MTARAISWLSTSKIAAANSGHLYKLISQLLTVYGSASMIGVLTGQYLFVPDGASLMVDIFKIFSVVFGVILLLININSRKQRHVLI